MTNLDSNSVGIDDKSVQGSLKSLEAHNGGFTSDAGLSDTEGTGASKIQRKVKKLQKKKTKSPGIHIYQFDDAREACSGAKEGHDVMHVEHEIDVEVRKQKLAMGLGSPRTKSHELFSPGILPSNIFFNYHRPFILCSLVVIRWFSFLISCHAMIR